MLLTLYSRMKSLRNKTTGGKQEVTEIFAVEEDVKAVQTTVTVIDEDEPTKALEVMSEEVKVSEVITKARETKQAH
jgi:hypothetical protein